MTVQIIPHDPRVLSSATKKVREWMDEPQTPTRAISRLFDRAVWSSAVYPTVWK
jgi:hypothetical protein